MKMYKFAVVVGIIFLTLKIYGQGVGIGTVNPDSSAILDIVSNDRGLLLPRLTSSQRQSIQNPAQGLLVFDTDENCIFFFDSVWTNLCGVDTSTSNFTNISMVYDDTIFRGDAVALGVGSTGYATSVQNAQNNNNLNAGQYWVAQTFITHHKTKSIKAAMLTFAGGNAGTHEVSIATIDTFSGEPDSVITTLSYYNNAGFTGERLFIFNQPVGVLPHTKYAVIIQVSNMLLVGNTNHDSFSQGSAYTSNDMGVTWSQYSGDLGFRIYEVLTDSGFIYKTDASYGYYDMIRPGVAPGGCFWGSCNNTYGKGELATEFIGFALEDGLPGETHPIQVMGVHSLLSGLVTGKEYYLSNQEGAITPFPGNQNKQVGKALTPNKLLIKQ